MLQIATLRHRDETGRREDISGIANIETDPFLEDPRFLEVVCRADKETVIAVHVFGGIVAETESGNELPASSPLLIQECVRPETRPEKPPGTRSQSE